MQRHLLTLISLLSCSNSTDYTCRAELSRILPFPSLLQAVQQNRSKEDRQLSTAVHLQKDKYCSLCHDGNHPLYLCAAFKAKSVEDRISIASRLKVCTNCLSYNHFSQDCPSRRSCRECGKCHHSSVHRQRPSSRTTENNSTSQSVPPSTNAHVSPACNLSREEAKVVLGVCQVTVKCRGRQQKARALLDSGSHMSFMTSRLAQSLKVKKKGTQLELLEYLRLMFQIAHIKLNSPCCRRDTFPFL